jgi:cobalt-zinc-cadmium efflux system membrane fusion protein
MKRSTLTLSLALVALSGAGTFLLATGRLRWGTPTSDAASRPAAGTSAEPGRPAGDEPAAEGGHIVKGRIVLDDDARKAAGLRTVPAATGSVATTLTVNGEVGLADGRWARVTPRIAGVVRELRAQVCDTVAIGQPLATVESAELGEAVAAYVTARNEKVLATRNAERWKALDATGFETKAGAEGSVGWVDLDQALADRDSATAERALAERIVGRAKELFEKGLKNQSEVWTAEQDSSRAQLRVDAARRRLSVLGAVAENERARASLLLDAAAGKLRILGLGEPAIAALEQTGAAAATGTYEVKSPLAGIVLERNATLGESVDAKDPVFIVADLSTVWVRASLYPKDMALVREGQPATVRVHGFPTSAFLGRVLHVGLRVDEKTRTLDLRIEVPNGSSPCSVEGSPLRPGAFASADVELARSADVLVIPVSAVQTIDGEPVVFVQVAEPPTPTASANATARTTFERRAVELGARDAEHVEVKKGLALGDAVVVENAFLLKSEYERSKLAEED